MDKKAGMEGKICFDYLRETIFSTKTILSQWSGKQQQEQQEQHTFNMSNFRFQFFVPVN